MNFTQFPEVTLQASLSEKIRLLKGPVLIFGASGFVGANLLNAVLEVRDDVYALTQDPTVAWRLKALDIPSKNVVFCDITSKASVRKVFEAYSAQTVFNLAAYGAYSKQSNANLIYETNLTGTLNILQECISSKVAAYIHAGSSSEYGLNCVAPDESAALEPNSHYSVSKISASYLIKYYAQFFNVPALNLRLYSVYGPWEEPDRLMPRLIENLRKGTLPPLVNPDISRDFIYVEDCIEAFIHAALYISPENYGKSLNIASGVKTTIRELVQTSMEVVGVNLEPEWGSMPDRKWDLIDWYGNAAAAKQIINWQSTTSLKAGLQLSADWQQSIGYEQNIIPLFENPKRNPKISCIIACYKDAQAIPYMYERLVAIFSQLKIRYEIIFVNDCSPDNTEEVIEQICNKDAQVLGITHSRNFGSQSAFLSGMQISTGDAVVLLDGDLQDPPEVIPEFYKKWMQGYEVIYGKRVKREASFIMQILYKLFYRIFGRLSYINIPLDAGDFSMIDRKVVNELIALPETEQFLRGLRAWVGFRQTGVDYVRPERMFGVSTNNWRKNFAWARKAIFSFTFVPIEMMSYFGFILTGLSFVFLIAQIIAKFLLPDTPHGITTIIVLVLFFGGIQILSIAIIGEYVSKIFEETKNRPKFIRTSIRKGNKFYNTVDRIDNFLKDRPIK